jgi:hypothetical protein
MQEVRAGSVTIRLSPSEFDMARKLALADGVSVSDVLRTSLRRYHDSRKHEMDRLDAEMKVIEERHGLR